MKNFKFIISIATLITIIGCGGGGGSSNDNNSSTNTPTNNLNITPNFNLDDQSSYQLQKTTLHINRRYGINDSSPCGCFYHAVAYIDLDNDGDTDVFMSGGNGSENRTPIETYINDGNGNFTLNNSLILGPEPGAVHPRKAILGDYNGDGKLDIFVADHGYDQPPFPGAHPLLFFSTSNGLKYSNSLEPYSGYSHAATSADIDNDGDIDIFVSDNMGESPFFLINDGSGNFSKNINRLTSEINGKPLFTAEMIDIDKDGYIDLIVAGHEFEGMQTTIYWGNSSGKYLSTNKTILPAVVGQGTVVDIDAEDVNNDGKRDIILTRTAGGEQDFYRGYYLQLLQNNGNHQFADKTNNISLNSDINAEWIDWIRIQDFNNDGFLDIVVDNASPNLVWLNNGNGVFTPSIR